MEVLVSLFSSKKQNRIRSGLIPGLLLPVAVFVAMYLLSGKKEVFSDYLYNLWILNALVKLLTLCVLPNLVLFLLFMGRKYDLAARGVLMATFLYAFIVVISKVF